MHRGTPAPLHMGNEMGLGPRKRAKNQEDRNEKGEVALDVLGASSENGSISTGFTGGCRATAQSTDRSRAQTANTGKVTLLRPSQLEQSRCCVNRVKV